MPYIAIKRYPGGDPEADRRVVEEISKLLQREWGVEPDWVSISLEELPPEEFDEQVEQGDMVRARGHMLLLHGEKLY